MFSIYYKSTAYVSGHFVALVAYTMVSAEFQLLRGRLSSLLSNHRTIQESPRRAKWSVVRTITSPLKEGASTVFTLKRTAYVLRRSTGWKHLEICMNEAQLTALRVLCVRSPMLSTQL